MRTNFFYQPLQYDIILGTMSITQIGVLYMRKRKLIASLIAFMMLFATASPLLQEVAFVLAAETIATLNGRSYSDFEDLVDDLEDDYEGESVVIEMKKDWNAASDDMFDEQLIIPESCNAVLNMHGHMFN